MCTEIASMHAEQKPELGTRTRTFTAFKCKTRAQVPQILQRKIRGELHFSLPF